MNAAYATDGWLPVVLRIRDDFPSSIAGYRQYDVLLVNSVMDGLNLVAEEAPLINTRDGVLVLSRCTGAWEALARVGDRRRSTRHRGHVDGARAGPRAAGA